MVRWSKEKHCLYCRLASSSQNNGYCLEHDNPHDAAGGVGYGEGIGKCSSCGSLDIVLIPYRIKHPESIGYIPVRFKVVTTLASFEHSFLYCPRCVVRQRWSFANDVYKAICDYIWKCKKPIIEGDDLYWSAMKGDMEKTVVLLQQGWNPRYMHDLPMRWATKENHLDVAILLFLHGSNDFSWVENETCRHPHHTICCHSLARYTPEFICRLAFLHLVTLSTLSVCHSMQVRNHVLNMIRTFTKMHDIRLDIDLESAYEWSDTFDPNRNSDDNFDRDEWVEIEPYDPQDGDEISLFLPPESFPQEIPANAIRFARACPPGFRLDAVPMDGDCFFHCFVKGLLSAKNVTTTVRELRMAASRVVLESKDLYEDLLEEWRDHGVLGPGETIPQNIASARVSIGREWATNTVIHILANVYEIAVNVHQQLENKTWCVQSFPYEFKEDISKNIIGKMDIVLHWWEHFDYLKPKVQRCSPSTTEQCSPSTILPSTILPSTTLPSTTPPSTAEPCDPWDESVGRSSSDCENARSNVEEILQFLDAMRNS